jgi:hypothetical protein
MKKQELENHKRKFKELESEIKSKQSELIDLKLTLKQLRKKIRQAEATTVSLEEWLNLLTIDGPEGLWKGCNAQYQYGNNPCFMSYESPFSCLLGEHSEEARYAAYFLRTRTKQPTGEYRLCNFCYENRTEPEEFIDVMKEWHDGEDEIVYTK